MTLDKVTAQTRKDGSDRDVLGPAEPTELADSSGAKKLISANQLYNMVEQNYILFHPALAFSLDEGTVSAP